MNLTIDDSVVMKARLAKICISQTVEDLLRAFLAVDPKDDEEMILKKEIDMLDDDIHKMTLKRAELECRLKNLERIRKEQQQQDLTEIVNANKSLQNAGVLRDIQ